MPFAHAQDFQLPAPGVMVHLSPPLNLPTLKGIKVHPDNPFKFDFILDRGDSLLNKGQLKDESIKLIKYFLVSITIPEKDLWVNLSPYEKDRIMPHSFGLTEMGRDLLAEDYMLKQITASLIYPEDLIGKKFWKRVYEETSRKYGTTNIAVNTFNKIWILPEKAVIYENPKTWTAYVGKATLKVMLDEDYLSLEKHEGSTAVINKDKTHALGSQIVREVVIPELIREVNENKNFAKLRQVFNSLILATWYKKKIKDSILSQVYANKNKVFGVNISDPSEKERIYQRYLRAFKKGVYNYIKEDLDPETQEIIPRKYFSGGMDFAMNATSIGINKSMTIIDIKSSMRNLINRLAKGSLITITAFVLSFGQNVMGQQVDANYSPDLGQYYSLLSNAKASAKRAAVAYKEMMNDSKKPTADKISQRSISAYEKYVNLVRIFNRMQWELTPFPKGKWYQQMGLAMFFDDLKRFDPNSSDPLIADLFAHINDLKGFSYFNTPDPSKPRLIFIPGIMGDPGWRGDLDFLKYESQYFNVIVYTFDVTQSPDVMVDTFLKEFSQAGLDKSDSVLSSLSFGSTLTSAAILKSVQDKTNLFAHSYYVAVGMVPGGYKHQDFMTKVEIASVKVLGFPPIAHPVSIMNPSHPFETSIAKNIWKIGAATKGGIDYVEAQEDHYIDYLRKQKNGVYPKNRDRVLEYMQRDGGHHIMFVVPPEQDYFVGNQHVHLFYSHELWEKIASYAPLLLESQKAKREEAKKSSVPAGALIDMKDKPQPVNHPDLVKNGGIDFTSNNFLQTQNALESFKFHLDPALLAQLKNARGFVPVIINIQPLNDLQQFLGLNESKTVTVG